MKRLLSIFPVRLQEPVQQVINTISSQLTYIQNMLIDESIQEPILDIGQEAHVTSGTSITESPKRARRNNTYDIDSASSDAKKLIQELRTSEGEKDSFLVTKDMEHYLNVLGLRCAIIDGQIEIATFKSVYREKLLATHPDRNPGLEANFQAIHEAYKAINKLRNQGGEPHSDFFQAEFESVATLKKDMDLNSQRLKVLDEVHQNVMEKVVRVKQTSEKHGQLMQKVRTVGDVLKQSEGIARSNTTKNYKFFNQKIASQAILKRAIGGEDSFSCDESVCSESSDESKFYPEADH